MGNRFRFMAFATGLFVLAGTISIQPSFAQPGRRPASQSQDRPAKLSGDSKMVWIEGAVGKLSAIIQTPELKEGEKVPMVILCHGFMGSKRSPLFDAISDSLVNHGIAVTRFDFNGHGESEGAFENMTVLNEIEDAKKVYRYVSGLGYVGKIAMAGHSQGGVVTAMTAGELGEGKLAAAVLMAPAAALRDDALRGSTFGKQYDAENPPAEGVELFRGRVIGRDYILTAQSLPIYETAALYQGPVLVLHGKADRLVPYTYGIHFHEVMRYSHIDILDGMDHGFSGHAPLLAGLVTAFFIKELQ